MEKRRAERTDSSRQMVSLQRLDILDLERIDVKVIHPQKGDCVLSNPTNECEQGSNGKDELRRKPAHVDVEAESKGFDKVCSFLDLSDILGMFRSLNPSQEHVSSTERKTENKTQTTPSP